MVCVSKKVIRCPAGFYFKIENDSAGYQVLLFDKSNRKCRGKKPEDIGYIFLERIYENQYQTHSGLDDKYHGKGLGALLYAKAISFALKNNFKVMSYAYPSIEAENVWTYSRLLRNNFNIRRRKESRFGDIRYRFHATKKTIHKNKCDSIKGS